MDEQTQVEVATQALEADEWTEEAHLGDAAKGKEDDEGFVTHDIGI
jgi:hypothetical protein